jgi:hypothetical protein
VFHVTFRDVFGGGRARHFRLAEALLEYKQLFDVLKHSGNAAGVG